MANQACPHPSINNILMVNTKYFKTACLGGYQDSSIVYQFQSSKLFRIKTILKFILPVSDALCQCGTIENNFHFLLECRRYNVMRREMLQTVSRFADVSERVLLYGDSNLSDTDNELVFKAVHKYIKQTKRFSSGN